MDLVMLLPSGSANERIPGTSHLYEHLLVKYCFKKKFAVNGFTTDDYIFFFFRNAALDEVLKIVDSFSISKLDVDLEKRSIRKEINKEYATGSETFFRKLWQGTSYEKSPLGSISGIDSIAVNDLKSIILTFLTKTKYLYNSSNCLHISNGDCNNSPVYSSPQNVVEVKRFMHDNCEYQAIHNFSTGDLLYYIREVVQLNNPKKFVDFFDKKETNSFVFEASCVFPKRLEFEALLPHASARIKNRITMIKNNFEDTGLNELESVYYHNKRWGDRCDSFLNVSSEKIFEIYEEIRNFQEAACSE